MTRVAAIFVVLTMAGPSASAVACELICAFGHCHDAFATTRSPGGCHEDHASADGQAAAAVLSASPLCHDAAEIFAVAPLPESRIAGVASTLAVVDISILTISRAPWQPRLMLPRSSNAPLPVTPLRL